ncbi:MAG: ATP-binding protein, partial [Candidatus Methanofastidiosia archaeon]
GSGKSYAAKKILLRLVDEGKTVIIFDLNGEYVNLGRDTQGNFGKYGQKITVLDPTALTPHENILPLQIPVNEMSYHDFAGIVGIEPKSDLYNQLILFWTRSVGDFDLDDFESWVNTNVGNFPLKFALKERIGVAKSLGLFGRVNFERIISRYEEAGGGIVVNFKFSSKRERMVIIEFIIKVITKLRKQKKINPIAIFAEEAQLYVSQNLWDDLLTRMRHYGIFPTFITNDPRTLPDEVFSLCDNLIAFRFHNTDDLEQLSKAKVIDRETLDVLKFLENKNCIFVGDCTDNFPIVVEIAPEKEVMMGGETQTMF